jgi:predicted ester cyclase
MSVEQNKATLKRLYEEVWNEGNTSVIPDLVSPEFFTRGLHKNFKGQEGYKEMVTNLRADIPDIHFTIYEMVGEGDHLTYRITGEGTYRGKKYKWTQALFTCYKEAKVAEALSIADNLAWYQPGGNAPPSYELKES